MSEIAVLDSFLDEGGSVFFLGEYSRIAANQNNYINAALGGLGSTMSLIDATFDIGDQYASGSQIADDPLTAGVDVLGYGAFSEVQLGSEGQALFYGSAMQPFMVYEGSFKVPEPSTLLLFGTGLLGVGIYRRRFRG